MGYRKIYNAEKASIRGIIALCLSSFIVEDTGPVTMLPAYVLHRYSLKLWQHKIIYLSCCSIFFHTCFLGLSVEIKWMSSQHSQHPKGYLE